MIQETRSGQRARDLWNDERGYAMSYWAVFLAVLLVPLMTLSWGLGRLFYVRGELQKAADAAALAAIREIDIAHFQNYREIQLRPSAVTYANRYAGLNANYMRSMGISPRVTDIRIDERLDCIFVRLEADVEELFPSIMAFPPIGAWGEAQARWR